MTKSPSPRVDEVAELVSEIWDDATNAVCQTLQQAGKCSCLPGHCVAARVEIGPKDLERHSQVIASLVSPPKASGEPVPVAWRISHKQFPDEFEPFVTAAEPLTPADREAGFTATPLYANHEARGDGVRVRKLEWDQNGKAVGCGVVYTVFEDASGTWRAIMRDGLHPVRSLGGWGQRSAALSSCQADLETRIRAALEAALPPLGDGRAEIVRLDQQVRAEIMRSAAVLRPEELAFTVSAIFDRSLSNPGGSE